LPHTAPHCHTLQNNTTYCNKLKLTASSARGVYCGYWFVGALGALRCGDTAYAKRESEKARVDVRARSHEREGKKWTDEGKETGGEKSAKIYRQAVHH